MSTNRIATHDQVCAIIVTYQPAESFFAHISALMTQIEHIVVVDNGSDNQTKQQLLVLEEEHKDKLTLLYNKENNLAKAQNMGIAHARSAGYNYVLLLDDDSEPAEGMVETMLNAYNLLPERQNVGLVAPHMIDVKTARETTYLQAAYGIGFKRQKAKAGTTIDHVLNVIASGSLIPVFVLDAVGNMDEGYVIDYLDKEFCLRLISKGYRVVVVSDAIMTHSIGHCKDHTLAGQRITATNHDAWRRYYIYRNRLRTCGRYILQSPSFVLYDLLAIGYDLLRIGLFERNRLEKYKAALSGALDAVKGVSGHRPEQDPMIQQQETANGD